MPLPLSYLISSPRRLFVAIVLFVVLDLGVLLINLWIAAQVAQDAVAINLAGRQRMLSQQTTKTLLLVTHAPDAASRKAAAEELAAAFSLFERTLNAFDQGGETRGGDGKPVSLRPVGTAEGRQAVKATLLLVGPLANTLSTLKSEGHLDEGAARQAMAYMVRNNRDILTQMNRLTTDLERDSIRRTQELRAIQTTFFLFALANFLVIVLGLVKRHKQLERDRHHWREIAQRDALTGLFNRAAFRDALHSALANTRAEQRSFCIMMLDLDGFKPINDRFGHAQGDSLLVRLAQQLRCASRETDVVARLGGDEFALLCPQLHAAEHIRQFCDRLIATIEQIAADQELPCRVTASIGVAVYPQHGADGDELLAAADRAKYAAKREGGGRWQVAEVNR
ncbi:MAG: diguanylate cyclase [bacterium]|nr:MAG: diguanylate cyclase [bacterium]KAF0150430.1 MAG: diguanylate cyclase [bacterium]KAF0168987.1 MAG: diguanylate cyclase [bacterium]TXT32830.1 MAG: diguanylate cyclase [Rhodocyclaceae bacterium]